MSIKGQEISQVELLQREGIYFELSRAGIWWIEKRYLIENLWWKWEALHESSFLMAKFLNNKTINGCVRTILFAIAQLNAMGSTWKTRSDVFLELVYDLCNTQTKWKVWHFVQIEPVPSSAKQLSCSYFWEMWQSHCVYVDECKAAGNFLDRSYEGHS